MHKNDYLHLDLKPENTLMMNYFTPVLTDFGLSKKYSEKLNFLVGTSFYLAPEIKSKPAKYEYTDKVDIYAMGVFFEEILSEI